MELYRQRTSHTGLPEMSNNSNSFTLYDRVIAIAQGLITLCSVVTFVSIAFKSTCFVSEFDERFTVTRTRSYTLSSLVSILGFYHLRNKPSST